MKPLDTLANNALKLIEKSSPIINQDSKHRSSWSLFLMSLMMRMPDHIALIKQMLESEWQSRMPELEQRYSKLKQLSDPATLHEYIQSTGGFEDDWIMPIVESLIDHAKIGELINSMRWFTRNIESGSLEYITSDRPLLMVGGLGEFDSFIMLPVGPKSLFVAVHNEDTRRRIEQRDSVEHVEAINRMVAGRAHKEVYAQDDRHIGIITDNFGIRRAKSLFQQLAEHRKMKTEISKE